MTQITAATSNKKHYPFLDSDQTNEKRKKVSTSSPTVSDVVVKSHFRKDADEPQKGLSESSSFSLTKKNLQPGRNPKDRPLHKLTVNLLKTYQAINDKYEEKQKLAELEKYYSKLRALGVTENPVRNPLTGMPLKGAYGRLMCCKDPNTVAKLQSPDKMPLRSQHKYTYLAEMENCIHGFLSGRHHIIERLGFCKAVGPGISKYAILMPNAGLNLYQKYGDKGATLSDVERIGKQLLEALEELGKAGILHADLKPENLMEDENGLVRVGDFGISQWLNQPESTPLVCSRYYRSPEEVCRIKPRSSATDMWSIACILFELLTGEVLIKVEENHDDLTKADVNSIYAFVQRLGLQQIPQSWALQRFFNNGAFKPSTNNHELPTMEARVQACPRARGKRGELFLDLLKKMLEPDATQRITARNALKHPFFSTGSDFALKLNLQSSVDPSQKIWLRIIPPEGKPITFNLTRAHSCYHLTKSDRPFTFEFFTPADRSSSSSEETGRERVLRRLEVELGDKSTIFVEPSQYNIYTDPIAITVNPTPHEQVQPPSTDSHK